MLGRTGYIPEYTEEYIIDASDASDNPNLDGNIFTYLPDHTIVSHTQFSNAIKVGFAMLNDEFGTMTRLIASGLDINAKLRRGKRLISLCKSVEMLNLLVSRGLHLSNDILLLPVPIEVFRELIDCYGLDPYECYYEFNKTKDAEKLAYINTMLARDRTNLYKSFLENKYGLPLDLIDILVNSCYPTIS
jgi:hypothetical protein